MSASAFSESLGSESFSIPNLVKLTQSGSIRVPSFQRSFVWEATDVRKFFDSIYRRFPVGTVILWRQKGLAGRIQIGPMSIDVDEQDNALWVVDGLQRITSLVGALGPGFDGVDPRFEVAFDLRTKTFVTLRRNIPTLRTIPVREALDSKRLINWLRRHSDDLENDDLDLADQLGGALREYKISAYVIEGDDREVLREVFDRVNSAGKPLGRAQIFHALFAGDTEPGSPASVIAELRNLEFGALDENRVVQSLLAIRGGNIQRDLRGEFDEGEDPTEAYDHAEQALARTIRYLKSEGIQHQLLTPSTLPIPILAAFFHLHPEPKPWTRRLLARWLWRGWVHGFGRSGQTPTLRRAISLINPVNRDRSQAPGEFDAVKALLTDVPDRPAPEIPVDEFRLNRENTRLILLALLSLRPLDPDGRSVAVPRQLETYGPKAITELVPGHRSRTGARGFWPHGAKRIETVSDHDILASHAIGLTSARHLASGEINEFLDSRERDIRVLVQDFLDSRLEPLSLVRPPLDDLVAAGLAEDEKEQE